MNKKRKKVKKKKINLRPLLFLIIIIACIVFAFNSIFNGSNDENVSGDTLSESK